MSASEKLSDLAISQLFMQLDKQTIDFKGVINFIDQHYQYQPTAFINGQLSNAPGENESSCKVFGFAHLHHLDKVSTLKLFAEHYASVKANPQGTDHANIRNFLFYGWQGFLMRPNCLTIMPV